MSHDELKEKLLKAMGGYPPAVARDKWRDFLINRKTEFTIRYDWIVDKRFYQWLNTCKEIDFGDGAETITVWTL